MQEVKNTKASKKSAQKAAAQAKKNEAKCEIEAPAKEIKEEAAKPKPAPSRNILKFQACDEKSFIIHNTPAMLGSEDPMVWKLKLQQQDGSIDKDLLGHSVMDSFDMANFKKSFKKASSENPENSCDAGVLDLLTKHDVQTKIAFSKCKNIDKHHAILLSSDSVFQLIAIKPVLVNKETIKFSDGPKVLKRSDMIQFPCEACPMPHIYHLIMPKDDVDGGFTQFNKKVFVPLLEKYAASHANFSRFMDMLEVEKEPTQEQVQNFKAWTCEQLRSLKRHLLMFGYGRWGKIRKVSDEKDQQLANETERSMRPYANLLLVYLAQCLDELPKLQQKTLEMIQVKEDDYVVYAHPHDFIAKDKAPESFAKSAPSTAKRILALTQLTELVRDYKIFRDNADEQETKSVPLLNFISSSSLAKLPKPTNVDIPWSRKDDCELLLDIYEQGTEKFDAEKVGRMSKIMQLVLCHKKRPFDFSQKIKEQSGFSYDEKLRIYEMLINFGVPTVIGDENKEDWELLKTILYKQTQGSEAVPPDDALITVQLEKFVNQMDVVSTKILKDYAVSVNEILQQWKEEDKENSKNSDSDSDNEEEKKNDFHIDKDRIRAAHFWEKTNKRLTFDPDCDGFNFGYEKALTFKVRVNLLRIIRKEILSNGERFWNDAQEALQQMNTSEAREKCKLPEHWKIELHDKNLLKAVSENGISFLSKLKENKDYGFNDIKVSRKRLLRRLEHICFFFKNLLPKYKKIYEKEKQTKQANLETGVTKIDLKKKFTKINLQRDLEGNIIYPIQVNPSLQILNLGVVEYERPSYHSEKNIFPIGWKSVREGTSMFQMGKRDTYICEIFDGGQKPLFKVTAGEDPDNPIIQNSASGVWIEICKRINELQGGGRTKVTVSGPDRYGLTEPGVTQLLACLPNADKCSKFNPNYGQNAE